jgi:hypothetical protein
MPRPGRLSAGPFNEAGFSPGPLDGKPSGGVNRPWCGYPARPVRFHEPEENRLSRSPGDFARVSPNHPGTGPTSPATQTGVSAMEREEVWHGF